MTSRARVGVVGPCGPQAGCRRYLPIASWPGQNWRASCDEGNPKRREVAGLHNVPIHDEKDAVRAGDAWNAQRFTSDLKPSRQRARDRRGLHVRERPDAIDQRSREARSRRDRVSRLGQVDRRELDVVGIEPRVDRCGPLQGAQEQATADDEHDAQRDLADDERVTKAQPADKPGVVSKPRQDTGLRRVKRGCESGRERRDQR